MNMSCANGWLLVSRAALFGCDNRLRFAARAQVAQLVQHCASAPLLIPLAVVIALLVLAFGRRLGFGLAGIP